MSHASQSSKITSFFKRKSPSESVVGSTNSNNPGNSGTLNTETGMSAEYAESENAPRSAASTSRPTTDGNSAPWSGKVGDGSNLSNTTAKRKKQKLAIQFKPEWRENRPWLLYTETEGMFCTFCRKHNKTPFGRAIWNTKPCVRFRLESIKEHEKAAEHRDSVRLEMIASSTKNIAAELAKPVEISCDGMVQAFKCLYFLAKNNIAHTTNFPELLELERLLGVDILEKINRGKTAKYTTTKAIKEMLECMSELIEVDILENIRKSDFSIMFDETTDVSVIEQFVIHARYIDEKGNVQSRFLKILDALASDNTETQTNEASAPERPETDMNELDHGIITLNADAICGKVTKYLEGNGLDYAKLRGIGTDGASVMTGKNNGAVKKIIERQSSQQVDENNPNKLINRAVGAHCAAHKLNLAAKQSGNDFPTIQKFKRVLTSLYAFYARSAVRDKGRSRVQELLSETLKESGKITSPAETRWLALGECAVKLKNVYTSVLVSLEREAEERADTTAAGLVKLMTKFDFVATLILLCEVLPTINRLSTVFQQSKVDFADVRVALSATLRSLLAKENTNLTTSVAELMERCNAQGISFRCQDLAQAISDFTSSVQAPFIAQLVANIQARFTDTDIMAAFAYVFDTSSYTSQNGELLAQNVKVLCDQFAIPMDQAMCEISDFTFYVTESGDDNSLGGKGVITTLISSGLYSSMFPSLSKLARIYTVLPPHTADCERDFSRLKLIKTNIRNRMGGRNP